MFGSLKFILYKILAMNGSRVTKLNKNSFNNFGYQSTGDRRRFHIIRSFYLSTVRSESHCALRFRYVDLVVISDHHTTLIISQAT